MPDDTAELSVPPEEIFSAIVAGDRSEVERYLDGGGDPNGRDARPRGRTLLWTATLREEQEIVDLLLNRGADPDLRDREGPVRPSGHGCIRFSDLRIPEDRGMTPLMLAAVLDAPAIARRLVEAGASLDLLDDTRHSALGIGAANGCGEVVRLLLEAGADTDLRLAEKKTALHVALDEGHPDLGLAMVRAGARVDLADRDGDTPLHVAASMGQDDVVRELLRHGADPAKTNRYGEDVLAVDGGLTEATRELLKALRAGADVDEALAEVPEGPAWPVDAELRRSYAPAAVRVRLGALAAGTAFRERVRGLEADLGVPTQDATQTSGAVLFDVSRIQGLDLPSLQDRCLEEGFVLVASAFDVEDRPETLALLPTADPYAAFAAFELNGANVGLDTAAIVAWWKEREQRLPVRFTGVTSDTLLGSWRSPPTDPEGLARELYELCPDVVDQGFGDEERLALHLAQSATFRLWWD